MLSRSTQRRNRRANTAFARQEFPWPWLARGAGYNLERMRRHGIRRAAEMREVATTLEELGIGNDMARATAWRQRIGDLQIQDDSTDLAQQADVLLQRLSRR